MPGRMLVLTSGDQGVLGEGGPWEEAAHSEARHTAHEDAKLVEWMRRMKGLTRQIEQTERGVEARRWRGLQLLSWSERMKGRMRL